MIFTSLFEKSENLKDEVLIIFLLCNCIPKMLLSGDIWNQTIFWLWIGVAASYFTQGRLPNGIEED